MSRLTTVAVLSITLTLAVTVLLAIPGPGDPSKLQGQKFRDSPAKSISGVISGSDGASLVGTGFQTVRVYPYCEYNISFPVGTWQTVPVVAVSGLVGCCPTGSTATVGSDGSLLFQVSLGCCGKFSFAAIESGSPLPPGGYLSY